MTDRALRRILPQGGGAEQLFRDWGIMRKIAPLCVAMSLFALSLPSQASAASHVVFHNHDSFSDTFADNICGVDGTSVVRGVDNFTLYSNNTFMDTFTLNLTFTSTATGKSIVLHVADQTTGTDGPIDNGNGTVTFITTFKGLPEQIRILNGPTLLRDAGTVTFNFTFRVDPVTGDFTFVSRTLSGLHGPHPDLLSDFAAFCNVIIPALS